MIKISRFFEPQFDDQSIGRLTFRKFTQDHIQRLQTQDKDALFTQMIRDTQAAHDKFFTAINAIDTNTSRRQGRTIVTNELLAEFKQKVSTSEGYIAYRLGRGSATYEEFFPHGLTEYSTSILENVEMLMTRFARAASAHSTILGPELNAEFNTLFDKYSVARDSQLNQKGMVNVSINLADEARKILEIQLTKNLYQLAVIHMGNPEAANMFFDQNIIRAATNNDSEEENDIVNADTETGDAVAV